MEKKQKDLIINIVLVVLFFAILITMYVVYIAGPARTYELEDRQYLQSIVEINEFESGKILNRFSYDQVYYIVEAQKNGETLIYWMNEDLNQSGSSSNLDRSLVKPLADKYGVLDSEITYGVYEGNLVYVFKKNNEFEIFIDVETLETLFYLGGV